MWGTIAKKIIQAAKACGGDPANARLMEVLKFAKAAESAKGPHRQEHQEGHRQSTSRLSGGDHEEALSFINITMCLSRLLGLSTPETRRF